MRPNFDAELPKEGPEEAKQRRTLERDHAHATKAIAKMLDKLLPKKPLVDTLDDHMTAIGRIVGLALGYSFLVPVVAEHIDDRVDKYIERGHYDMVEASLHVFIAILSPSTKFTPRALVRMLYPYLDSFLVKVLKCPSVPLVQQCLDVLVGVFTADPTAEYIELFDVTLYLCSLQISVDDASPKSDASGVHARRLVGFELLYRIVDVSLWRPVLLQPYFDDIAAILIDNIDISSLESVGADRSFEAARSDDLFCISVDASLLLGATPPVTTNSHEKNDVGGIESRYQDIYFNNSGGGGSGRSIAAGTGTGVGKGSVRLADSSISDWCKSTVKLMATIRVPSTLNRFVSSAVKNFDSRAQWQHPMALLVEVLVNIAVISCRQKLFCVPIIHLMLAYGYEDILLEGSAKKRPQQRQEERQGERQGHGSKHAASSMAQPVTAESRSWWPRFLCCGSSPSYVLVPRAAPPVDRPTRNIPRGERLANLFTAASLIIERLTDIAAADVAQAKRYRKGTDDTDEQSDLYHYHRFLPVGDYFSEDIGIVLNVLRHCIEKNAHGRRLSDDELDPSNSIAAMFSDTTCLAHMIPHPRMRTPSQAGDMKEDYSDEDDGHDRGSGERVGKAGTSGGRASYLACARSVWAYLKALSRSCLPDGALRNSLPRTILKHLIAMETDLSRQSASVAVVNSLRVYVLHAANVLISNSPNPIRPTLGSGTMCQACLLLRSSNPSVLFQTVSMLVNILDSSRKKSDIEFEDELAAEAQELGVTDQYAPFNSRQVAVIRDAIFNSLCHTSKENQSYNTSVLWGLQYALIKSFGISEVCDGLNRILSLEDFWLIYAVSMTTKLGSSSDLVAQNTNMLKCQRWFFLAYFRLIADVFDSKALYRMMSTLRRTWQFNGALSSELILDIETGQLHLAMDTEGILSDGRRSPQSRRKAGEPALAEGLGVVDNVNRQELLSAILQATGLQEHAAVIRKVFDTPYFPQEDPRLRLEELEAAAVAAMPSSYSSIASLVEVAGLVDSEQTNDANASGLGLALEALSSIFSGGSIRASMSSVVSEDDFVIGEFGTQGGLSAGNMAGAAVESVGSLRTLSGDSQSDRGGGKTASVRSKNSRNSKSSRTAKSDADRRAWGKSARPRPSSSSSSTITPYYRTLHVLRWFTTL
jgi:hypothetical protein